MSQAMYAQDGAGTITFELVEARMVFDAPAGWSFFSKTGKLKNGKVQYSYSFKHQVAGKNRSVTPSLTITLDKASWFSDEVAYLADKMDFHRTMNDKIHLLRAFNEEPNPLKINAQFAEGTCGVLDHPNGQKLILVSFWNESFGFHLEMQSSPEDFQANQEAYSKLLSSIRFLD